VTWSYSDRYVGWAPLPPSVVFGASGYSGRPVVVSQTQYVFVPTNRFVDTDVTSVRVSAQESVTIFRQTTPVTRFGVSDGIVRNTGVPVETIQRAAGGRIETRSISAANTTPHSVTAGGSGKSRQLAVVAPARELNAAVAAGPKETSRPASSSGAAKSGRAQVSHESTAPRAAAKPERREPKTTTAREAPRAAAKPERREPNAPKVREAPRAAAKPERREPKAPKAREAPPAQSHGQAAQGAPAERRQEPPPRAGADPGARPAPAPAAQAAPPNQDPGHGKPAKKDKEKDKKDEKN
jgi:hypothetical protein